MNLTKTSWPGGWNPSQDDVNGSSDALLRMDNLRQNELGVLALTRGMQKLNAAALSDYVSRIYSKIINNVEYIWSALNAATTNLIRSGDNFNSYTSIGSNGGNQACFGDALGKVLICAGSIRIKDSITKIEQLGLIAPLGPPSVTDHDQPTLFMSAAIQDNIVPVEGINFITYGPPTDGYGAQIDSSLTLRGIMEYVFPSVTDTTVIGEGPSADPTQDTFSFEVIPLDSFLINTIRIEIQITPRQNFNGMGVLDPTFPSPLGTDYYYNEWPVQSDSSYVQGINQSSILQCTRDQFTRVGTDNTVDWTTVYSIHATFIGSAATTVAIDQFHFIGGALGQLNGVYQWAQIDVNDEGTYIAKSPISPTSDNVQVTNGYVTITPNPTEDPQVTAHWIYRQSVTIVQPVGSTIPPPPDLLNSFFLVATTPTNTPVDDTISDDQAILNQDITNIPNLSLQSLRDTDDIVGMEGLFNGRMLYLTSDQILLGDYLNLDAIDLRFTIKAFGDPTEKNLFLKKITNNQLLLATTKDLYEINGTLIDLPDGTIDASVISIGEKYPPLSSDYAFIDGYLYYMGANGIRQTTGSNSTGIGYSQYQQAANPQLALLFQGETRFGVLPIAVIADNQAGYPMCIGHGNLYATVLHSDLTRSLLVYNFATNTYRRQITDPLSMWVTQTDRLLFGFGGNDNYIREFESGTTIDGTFGQSIFFQTIYDNNQQPRNRKDTFTLKIIANTGGGDVQVYLAKDKGNFVGIGTINSSVETTFYIDVDQYGLGFRYAVQLQAASLTTFYLYEMTLEYDPRPEQVNYLHIPNTNQGSYARKRWTSFAFVIDTLGDAVTFTPYVDNAAGAPSSPNTATKLTYVHYFTQETIGTDTGGILKSPTGQPFEFYGVNLEETVSEKLPTPCEYLVIPANDYGIPNRKRFTSYKFQINTRGQNVQLTPRIDGTAYASEIFNTTEKRTVEYFFDTSIDVTGIDIGGVLQTLAATPFEFYGTITPQQVEQLPPRLCSLYTTNNNYGVAARKRLRTIPIIINTNGIDVTFTPVVDGINGATTILNSSRKQTLYHFFTTDVFCTDIAGIFTSTYPFEFYEFGQPESVEVLPVPKKYDQLQPLRFDKIGKLFALRLRIIPVDSTLPYAIYSEVETTHPQYSGIPLFSGIIPVVPHTDDIYEVTFPKSINSDIIRIVLGPTVDAFHRYDLTVKVSLSGTETDSQWMQVK